MSMGSWRVAGNDPSVVRRLAKTRCKRTLGRTTISMATMELARRMLEYFPSMAFVVGSGAAPCLAVGGTATSLSLEVA